MSTTLYRSGDGEESVILEDSGTIRVQMAAEDFAGGEREVHEILMDCIRHLASELKDAVESANERDFYRGAVLYASSYRLESDGPLTNRCPWGCVSHGLPMHKDTCPVAVASAIGLKS